MLIINADDLGRSERATNSIIECYCRGAITSASAMVYMSDSARAAEMSTYSGLQTGLHLNLTEVFDGPSLPPKLYEMQKEIAAYYRSAKWKQIIYDPRIRREIDYLYKSQCDEYRALYAREPDKIDGHHHAHLYMNMIIGKVIPKGARVRRNFTFARREKNALNRLYRRLIDLWLLRRYFCADFFFSLEAGYDYERLTKIVSLSRESNVELAVHPENNRTLELLLAGSFHGLISETALGTYRSILPGVRSTT